MSGNKASASSPRSGRTARLRCRPKGTTSVWDAGHLVFLHVHSPHTVDNLRHNPHVEINVVDPIVRKGYRFAGLGRVVSTEAEVSARWRQRHLDLDLSATEAQ